MKSNLDVGQRKQVVGSLKMKILGFVSKPNILLQNTKTFYEASILSSCFSESFSVCVKSLNPEVFSSGLFMT